MTLLEALHLTVETIEAFSENYETEDVALVQVGRAKEGNPVDADDEMADCYLVAVADKDQNLVLKIEIRGDEIRTQHGLPPRPNTQGPGT